MTTASKLDVPFSFELDSGVSSKVFHGFTMVIGLANIGGGINAVSNSLIIYFKLVFPFSISSIDTSIASLVALWIQEILEGDTPLRSNFELDFP